MNRAAFPPDQLSARGVPPRESEHAAPDSSDLQKPTNLPIPQLDFSKLSTNTTTTTLHKAEQGESEDRSNNDIPRKSFEMTFQRQARLAKMLKKK